MVRLKKVVPKVLKKISRLSQSYLNECQQIQVVMVRVGFRVRIC